jgi:periplasmic divalent cation tolerance protein
MNQPRILYVTTASREEARTIGRSLVENKLCACVNILGDMESIYPWDGDIQTDSEQVMLVKTTAELASAATDAILELHSYDVPCVISLPLSETEGNPDYLDWIRQTTANTK